MINCVVYFAYETQILMYENNKRAFLYSVLVGIQLFYEMNSNE